MLLPDQKEMGGVFEKPVWKVIIFFQFPIGTEITHFSFNAGKVVHSSSYLTATVRGGTENVVWIHTFLAADRNRCLGFKW